MRTSIRHLLRACLGAIALIAGTGPASAQDQPVVFLHGFASSGDAWHDTAARLQAEFAIEAHTPTTEWRSEFQAQANDVNSQTSSLASDPIAIGHSNGGLVARQWSRQRQLRGIVTLGTPNLGAPFASNVLAWSRFNQDFYARIRHLELSLSLARQNWTSWVLHGNALALASILPDPTMAQIVQAIGLRASFPVLPQMATNSTFLTGDLNSQSNVAAEAQAVPNRVAIVSYDPRYYYGGPYWIIDPDNAPSVAAVIQYAGPTLMYAANAIRFFAEADDFTADDVADALVDIASWVRTYNDAWCYTISSVRLNQCWLSDGLVPAWSQPLPGSNQSQWIDFEGGPPHTRQIAESDDALSLALTDYMSVPVRSNTSGGSGGGGSTGGGGNGSGGGSDFGSGDTLSLGQRLGTLVSADGRFEFVYQEDGNLVLYAPGGVALWSTGTSGSGEAVLQGDGNLVIYNSASQAVWSSGTEGRGDILVVQNDGNVVIYDAERRPVWSTGTAEASGGRSAGGGGNTGGGGGGSPDACASDSTHAHDGRCGEADACGHTFGSNTDCGCSSAPIVYDTCHQTVCDTVETWTEDFCQGSTQTCDWIPYCWYNSDGVNAWEECSHYPDNCRDETYTYACGGHWDSTQGNCRDEASQCNPHQCGN
jgi:pimeloyl-ACP methyl ester carboxylesterase